MDVNIKPFDQAFTDAVIELAIEAWTPVFEKTETEVPRFVYEAFYPEGWEKRQRADVSEMLSSASQDFFLAMVGSDIAGCVAFRMHPEDRMGEVYFVAVTPAFQRRGIARKLMTFAEEKTRAEGMEMVMVETIDDGGHHPARMLYENTGFSRWPVARYFKPLKGTMQAK